MSIEKSIKERAKKIGMDMCGIAPISRFEGAPKGTHPTDFLPGCKSVVSVGVRLADGVIQTIMRNFEDGNQMAQAVYGTYGYTMAPNFHLLYSVYDIAQYIERNTGFAAMPTQVGPMMPGMSISQRHAAVAAGLGEFGWLSIVLTPKFGPRNRFGAILTTAELKPLRPHKM
jgi:epoxyqueuosine reductase